MVANRNGIKVFVSSTVHEVQNDLDHVYALLDSYGYDVMLSHKGTIPLNSKVESAFQSCLQGVKDCDVFLGFIRPSEGSGKNDREALSITAQEFELAYQLNKLRFVMADYRVEFAHSYAKAYCKARGTDYKTDLVVTKFVSKDCVEVYIFFILDDSSVMPSDRIGNWVQPYDCCSFHRMSDVDLFLEAQFKDVNRIIHILRDGQ